MALCIFAILAVEGVKANLLFILIYLCNSKLPESYDKL